MAAARPQGVSPATASTVSVKRNTIAPGGGAVPVVANKYLAPAARDDDDPNGIHPLTKNVVGHYTQREIEQVMELQAKADAYQYVPQDSEGGFVADNGTDPLYSFQSNLNPIQRILKRPFVKAPDEDEDEGLSKMSDHDLKNSRQELLHALAEDTHNNQSIAEERDRTLRTQTATKEMYAADSPTTLLELLQHAQQDPDSALHVPTPLDQKTLAAQGVKRVEFKGTAEKQAAAFNSMLKLRNDQISMLAKLLQVVTCRLEESVNENARLHLQKDQTGSASSTVGENGGRNHSEETAPLLKRIDDLEREQDFLYRRLYGNTHQTDVRVDRAKKYRKDVDETYEQMVAAEVAKRLAGAVKNGDAVVKQLRAEQTKMRRMLERCTSFANRTQWMLKTAMKSNRSLETRLLEMTLWKPPPPPTPPLPPLILPVATVPTQLPTPKQNPIATPREWAHVHSTAGHHHLTPSSHLTTPEAHGLHHTAGHRPEHTHRDLAHDEPEQTPSSQLVTPDAATGAQHSVEQTPLSDHVMPRSRSGGRNPKSSPSKKKGSSSHGAPPSPEQHETLPHQLHDAMPPGRTVKSRSRRESGNATVATPSNRKSPAALVRPGSKSVSPRHSLTTKLSQPSVKSSSTPMERSGRSQASSSHRSSTGGGGQRRQSSVHIIEGDDGMDEEERYTQDYDEEDNDVDDADDSAACTPHSTLRSVVDCVEIGTSTSDLIRRAHSAVQTASLTPPAPDAAALAASPVAKQLTKGSAARYNRCSMCALAVGDITVLWEKCPTEVEAALALAAGAVKSVATACRGLVAKEGPDSFLVLFDGPVEAATFAFNVQTELLRLNYADALLAAAPSFAAMKDVTGRLSWRGLRFAASLTVGSPFAYPHTNVPGSVELGPDILSEDVTRLLELVLSVHAGDVTCCPAFAEELSPFLAAGTWHTSDKPANPKAFTATDRRCSSLSVCFGCEEHRLRLRSEGLLRSFPLAAPPLRTGGCAAAGWLDTMQHRLGTKKHNPVAFVALEVQHASSFTDLSDEAVRVVNATASYMTKDILREVGKFDGISSIETACGALAVFPTVVDAMQFIFSCHARAMHVKAPVARDLAKLVPLTTERFVDGVLTSRGLAIRAAVHFGRPEDVIMDSMLAPPRYVGSSVDLTLALGTAARYGETIVDDTTLLAIQRSDEELGGPVHETIATRTIERKTVDLISIHPKLLQGRLRILKNALPEPTPILRVTTLQSRAANDGDDENAPLDLSQTASDLRSVSSANGHPKGSDPITIAKVSQRIYRSCWTAADRTAKVIGFPVEHDFDPVVADSDLRAAIAEQDPSRSASETVATLMKIDSMINDICIALSCRTERNTRLHHAVQTAIMIAPFDTDDSALYKNSDVGTSVINTRGRDNNSPTGVIRRLGPSSDSLSMQVSDMRIAALERENDDLLAALEIANQQLLTAQPPGTPTSLAKLRRGGGAGTSTTPNVSRSGQQLFGGSSSPAMLLDRAHANSTPSARPAPALPPAGRRPATSDSGAHPTTVRGAILSPLQIKYSPVSANGIVLSGGQCAEASLARPFSRGTAGGASRPASVASVRRSNTSRQGGPRSILAAAQNRSHDDAQSRAAAAQSASLQAGEWETLETELDDLTLHESSL